MGPIKIARAAFDIATFCEQTTSHDFSRQSHGLIIFLTVTLLTYVSIVGIFIRPKGFTWFRNTAYAAVRILTRRKNLLDLRK
jgi:hypothetical protein